jgi:hypothetical protein
MGCRTAKSTIKPVLRDYSRLQIDGMNFTDNLVFMQILNVHSL